MLNVSFCYCLACRQTVPPAHTEFYLQLHKCPWCMLRQFSHICWAVLSNNISCICIFWLLDEREGEKLFPSKRVDLLVGLFLFKLLLTVAENANIHSWIRFKVMMSAASLLQKMEWMLIYTSHIPIFLYCYWEIVTNREVSSLSSLI